MDAASRQRLAKRGCPIARTEGRVQEEWGLALYAHYADSRDAAIVAAHATVEYS